MSLVVKNPSSCNLKDSSVVLITVTTGSANSVTISTSNSMLCPGDSSSLTASPALSYSWSNGATNSLTIVSPTISTNYTLSSIDINGCATSAVFTQVVQACTDLSETSLKIADLNVYPNPSTDELNVHASLGIRSIKVYDIFSRLLMELSEQESNHKRLNLKSFSDGMYLIQVQLTNDLIVLKKVSKQN